METVFERMCAELGLNPVDGEELDYQDQEELVRCSWQIKELNASHAKTRRPGFAVEVGFFKSSDFRAFAALFEEIDVIAISWAGVIITLRDLFLEVMALPVFSWVPEAHRAGAAVWFFECGKHFIFLHELGHIWNGHTSLRMQRGIAPHRQGGLLNIDLQTLEFDADSFAAANIFNFGVISHPFPSVKAEFEDRFGQGATYLAMTAFAIHMVFRLFDQAADFDPDEKRSHPSPPLRQRTISGALAAHAEKKGVFKEQDAWDPILQGMSAAEDVFASRGGRPRDDAAIKAALSRDGGKYLDKLLLHWHVLRPQLDPLKRGGTLPATQEVGDDDI